ncbi:MAG: hypothetical protein IPM79_38415 [Polyangiaceae bacterium]|jgi:hypothetical protein|nr:hypothetical protein [Polyangiaceae bacterium]
MADDTTQVLLAHSVLVGLTPLIPIPILDDYVKDHVERRLTLEIGRRHGIELAPADVAALMGEGEGGLLRSVATAVVTFPLRLVFRKLFMVLEVKRASDEASRSFHYAYLLDRALSWRAMAPHGAASPGLVREAIVAACEGITVSPMAGAFRAVLEGSKDLVAAASESLLRAVRPKQRGAHVAPEDVQRGVDAASNGPVSPIVERLKAAMNEVPSEHFAALEAAFAAKLGVSAPPFSSGLGEPRREP